MHQVLLTFIGGGVFGNAKSWITSAFAKACAKVRDHDLEVIVVHYAKIDDEVETDIQSQYEAEVDKLQQLIQLTPADQLMSTDGAVPNDQTPAAAKDVETQ